MGSPIDARADVYAVGLIAWRMLAGRHPFKAEDARSLLMMQATRPVPPLTEARPDLAAYPGLVAAVAKACAKEPGDAPPERGAPPRRISPRALGPAFMMPPGATPAPPPSISASPSPSPARPRAFADDGLRDATRSLATSRADRDLALDPLARPPPARRLASAAARRARRLVSPAVAARSSRSARARAGTATRGDASGEAVGSLAAAAALARSRS